MTGLNRLDAHQPLTNEHIPLAGSTSISQTFYSAHDNLNIVSICIRNPHRLLAPLEFSLHEATTSAKSLRTIQFSTGNIDNFDCTRFQFAPVGDSSGKQYAAQIRPVESQLTQPITGVYVEAHNGQDYKQGDAYLNEVATPLDLHFKTNYYQSLSTVAVASVSQFVTRLGQDPFFFIIYALIISAVLRRLWSTRHDK